MARPRTADSPEAGSSILEATVDLLRERRTGDVTTEEIARRAGCAKGLVHYHFKSKPQLLVGAAERLWIARSTAWTGALGVGDPQTAIGAGWQLITKEATDGTAAACAAIGLGNDELVVRSVNTSRRAFASALTGATSTLLGRMGLAPSVPTSELGTLLAATIEGITLQLGSGAESDELEQAWAAFWVGLLALTRPRRA
jgi:AcrR family transcriptional regulator